MAHTPEVSRFLGALLHGKLVSPADQAVLREAVEDPKVKTIGDFSPRVKALINAIETDTNDKSVFSKQSR